MSLGEVFTLLGYLTGALVLVIAARGKKLATEGMAKVAAAGFVGGILGAKLTQMIAEGWPVRIPAWTIADPRAGGRALLGGLIFGWISVEIAKRVLGIKRATGDLFALALPAGEAVGRIGCFFNGCCYGSECDLPWAVEQHGALRHPAQLYTSLVAAATFGFLLWLKPRLTREGDLFKAYLLIFGSTRFLLEFVRWRETVIWGLSPMQWFCLELVVGVLISVWIRSRRARVSNRA